MRITKTYNWSRRDFCASMECESCKRTQENDSCYDDENYYDNVVPNIKCKKCGESTNSLGLEKQNISTRYNPNTIM